MSDALDDLLRVKAFVRRYPELATESAMRWQIHNAASNGLHEHGAIIKIGRAVYIHRGRYLDWLLSHTKGEPHRTVTPAASADTAPANGSSRRVTAASQPGDGENG